MHTHNRTMKSPANPSLPWLPCNTPWFPPPIHPCIPLPLCIFNITKGIKQVQKVVRDQLINASFKAGIYMSKEWKGLKIGIVFYSIHILIYTSSNKLISVAFIRWHKSKLPFKRAKSLSVIQHAYKKPLFQLHRGGWCYKKRGRTFSYWPTNRLSHFSIPCPSKFSMQLLSNDFQ